MQAIVVSDLHCGCRLALCPPKGVALDDGGRYMPSKFQLKLWNYWKEFSQDWLPKVTQNKPFALIVNGDTLDGVHHNSTTQISQNLVDQKRCAVDVLQPLVDRAGRIYYHIRGTEAHVGKSGVEEERLAEDLHAIPNSDGQYARYDLWKIIGKHLVHLLHHIGTSGSSAYEATAVHKELVEQFSEAGRWGDSPPDCVVRSHRHRYLETSIPTSKGKAIAVVTPGWQGKTPFAWKIAGARLARPQFGGILIRSDEHGLYIKNFVRTIERSPVE